MQSLKIYVVRLARNDVRRSDYFNVVGISLKMFGAATEKAGLSILGMGTRSDFLIDDLSYIGSVWSAGDKPRKSFAVL